MNRSEEKKTFLSELLAAIGFSLFLAVCLLLKTYPDRLIGAAFCHQIASRSPSPDFPFCYRCSGLFFGITWSSLSRLVMKNDQEIFTFGKIALFLCSFILFLADIVNTSPYIGLRWYADQPVTRFLSAFPLGFSLAGIIMSVFCGLFTPLVNGHFSVSADLLFMTASWIFSWLMLFRTGSFGMILARLMITVGSFVFVMILYSILIKCIVLLKNSNGSSRSIILLGCFSAFCQVSILGAIHIMLLHFELLA